MVYLTNTWTVFLKLVYIPVHPGFIDILSFELECHPSNAPEKVEEGIIVILPRPPLPVSALPLIAQLFTLDATQEKLARTLLEPPLHHFIHLPRAAPLHGC